ncbi:hypothetical protein AB0392_31415 [Nonomuraea angiospora]|uniref:hypothetical protein n=1 Tax=Nonomuraea angiospora TaxID=46172 RepID=UPI00344F9C71
MSNAAHAPVLSARGSRKEYGKGEVLVSVPAVAALTAVPAHLGGRRPVTATL